MARTKSAERAARVAERKRARNKPISTSLKTYISKAQRLILKREMETAREAVAVALQALDKAAAKGVIHPNNAARRKSRLMAKLNEASQS